MSDHNKLWFQQNLNKLAINRAKEVINQTGAALPCRVVAVSGSIVTVSFEVDSTPWTLPQITIPKVESNWIRYPTQVGDTGITIPSDVYHGIVSGIGGGIPNINVTPGNFSALIFVPVSNKNSPPSDPNAAIAQGPNGAVMQTTTGTTSSVKTNTSGTTIAYGSNTAVLNSTGFTVTVGTTVFAVTSTGITMTAGGVTVTLDSGGLDIGGINFASHKHVYTPGAGTPTDTGVPVP